MDENLEIIDLTQSFSYCRAPINLSCSVIELDDSIDQVPEATPAPIATAAEPINIECEIDVLPAVNVSKKSRETNKKRKSKTPCDATSPKRVREKCLHLGHCPICHDVLGTRRMASTKCGHVYCLTCIEKSLKFEKKCPTCRKPLKGAYAYHPLFV